MTTHAASVLAHCRPFRDLAAADLEALAAFARVERVLHERPPSRCQGELVQMAAAFDR